MPIHSECQKIPLTPKFRGSGTLLKGAGVSAGPRVRFVEPAHSDLHGNITTFRESRLLEARSERAFNACVYTQEYWLGAVLVTGNHRHLSPVPQMNLVPPKYEGTGYVSEGPGESVCPHVRFCLINIHIPITWGHADLSGPSEKGTKLGGFMLHGGTKRSQGLCKLT